MFKSLCVRLCWITILITTLSSCKKNEEVLIANNTPPPDNTITEAVKENYINKVYISVLGREPDSLELKYARIIINKNNISVDNRRQLLDSVLNQPEYFHRVYQIARTNLLDGLDTAKVTESILVYSTFLQDSTYLNVWSVLQYEISRLKEMKKIPADLELGVLTISGMYARCINNSFYDMINMGTENFVVSVFFNFFFRYPTISELDNAKLMVDGAPAVVLMQSGKNKADFINLIINSNDYYEGAVRALYKQYLFREPNSQEVTAKTALYKSNNDYKALQKDILSTNEYAGIK